MMNKQAVIVPSQKEKLQLILRRDIREGNQCNQKLLTTDSLASLLERGDQGQIRLLQSVISLSFIYYFLYKEYLYSCVTCLSVSTKKLPSGANDKGCQVKGFGAGPDKLIPSSENTLP